MVAALRGRAATFVVCVLIVGLCPPSGASGDPLPHGNVSTAKHDASLRRDRYPLTVKLIEFEGKGGTDVPVTLSVACGEGDYPKGQLCPVLNGRPVPAQVDVLATWPRDGSIRHALVSLVVPRIAAGGTLEFALKQAVAPRPRPFELTVSLEDFAVKAEFDNPDGKKTISMIAPTTMEKISKILSGEAEAGDLAPRLAGPVCYEFEVHDVPKTDGAPDPDIDVLYRVRVYSGFKGVRVAYVVENDRMPAKPYPKEFTVSDRDFSRLAFLVGPSAGPKVVYEHGPVTHWYQTRYRVLRWWGERPPPTGTRGRPTATAWRPSPSTGARAARWSPGRPTTTRSIPSTGTAAEGGGPV